MGRSIGLRTRVGQGPAPASLTPLPPSGRNWSVEMRPLSACEALVPDWTALGRRALAPHPFFEPGFLLPACQHLVAFRDLRVLLIWKGGPGMPGRQLVALLPVERRSRWLRPDLASGCSDARLLCDWPLIDRDMAVPALSALLRGFAKLDFAERRLRLHGLGAGNPMLAALADTGLPLLRESTGRFDDPVPALPQAGLLGEDFTLREAETIGELRDGVEILMALEASGPLARAGGASLQDVREAAFLRAMTRQLARARLCRIALLMQGGRPVAGALTLGKGGRRWLYKLAVEDAAPPHALALRRALIAAMREAAPRLEILTRGDHAGGGGQGTTAAVDVVFQGAAPRSPADLARALRQRLDRALFRPPSLAAGE